MCWPIRGIPQVRAGDDLSALIAAALEAGGMSLRDGDIVVVASKVVSKSLGLRAPAGLRAALVLAESSEVIAERATPGGEVTRIVRTWAGPALAGAGIDASNTGPDPADGGTVLLLPRDPDAQARRLRTALARRCGRERIGVIIADTSGRPWRIGQVDYALGAAGVRVLDDLRGHTDADGRPLTLTQRALADELACTADLVKGKREGIAAVLMRGLAQAVLPPAPEAGQDAHEPPGTDAGEDPGQGAARLTRRRADDWFSLGRREAVLAALGLPPGSDAARTAGLPGAGESGEDDAADGTELAARAERAIRAALHPGGCPVVAPGPWQAGHRSRSPLAGVSARFSPAGVHVGAPDDFTLGLACARLIVALAAEHIPAALADSGPHTPLPEAAGRTPASATILFG